MLPNPLAALKIDRCAERREQSDWITAAARSAQARFVVTHNGRLLAAGERQLTLRWLGVTDLDRDHHEFPYFAFLGVREQTPLFVVELDQPSASRYAETHQADWVGARRLALTGELADAGIAAYGRALTLWQRNHRHCGRCGSTTQIDQAGFRLVCSAADCGHAHFPRLDPAIIVAVGHEGRCLLGRQPTWPEKRYSTLAGFVEPGESVEDALLREVAEESGVKVNRVYYHSSQPWPFPSSLMLGFLATADDPTLSLGDELEHAMWLDADELRAAMMNDELILPPPLSISHRLIKDWYQAEYGVDITSWQRRGPKGQRR